MESKSPSSWFSGRSLFLVLGAFFLVVSIFLWLVPGFFDEEPSPQEVIIEFIEAAADGDADQAVKFHSSRANYRDSLAELIRTGAYGQILEGYNKIDFVSSVSNTSDRGPTTTFTGFVILDDRENATLRVTLIEEDGSWKIDGFDIGANP